MTTTQNLFLNYHPLTGFSINVYRNTGWYNDDVAGFVKDFGNNVPCCIELKNVENIDLTDLHSKLSVEMPDYDILVQSINEAIAEAH